MSSRAELPGGTVTFLFTDIEGSTRLLKQLRERYAKALAEHQRILREAFDEHGGREIDTQGDSFFVAFPRATDAVAAAVEAQHALAAQTWPEGAELRVRMGVHTGEPTVGEERYVGLGVHRVARITAAGHGGQVLVSQTTRELLRDDPLPDVSLRDLGEHHLKDLDEPERIYQLVAPGLAEEFPPLKATASTPLAGREVELVEAAPEFRILGPLEASEEGRPLDLGGGKQRALLSVLLLNANRVVSRDRLIDALWAEEPPETAVKALQVYVSQLRKALGRDVLVTRAPGYMVQVGEGQLDLDRFEALREEARHCEPADAAARLREALSLWRGPPLGEFALEFAQGEIARLEELFLGALEGRIEADLALGRHAELVGELEALVTEHPLREGLRSQLMLALYRSRRQAEALEVYQQARRALVEELGIDPGRALRELEQAILRQDPALDFVAGAKPTADATRGAFVGRETELAELVAGLEDALAGAGRLLLLVGEPGIGKSRLGDELIAHARARGARVLVGRCWEAGGAPAYWPWMQALRSYLRDCDPVQLRRELGRGAPDLAQLLPELRELYPDLPEPASLDPDGARFRLFDSVSSFLLALAAERPLFVALDDLHAADEPSLLLLRFVAREIASGRLLVLGAYRDVDPTVSGPLASTVAELIREPVTRRIMLAGLEEGDVAQYLELTTGLPHNEKLAGAIHAETQGNPLFVGEVVRLLAAEGRLGEGGDVRLGIPQGIRDAIGQRLARLSEECGDLLALASVLGRDFGLDALERTSGIASDELVERLDEAVGERVITEVMGAPGRLRFSHVLVRDSLYESLPAARRLQLHLRAGEALEQLYAHDPEPYLAELAHHFLHAGGTGTGKAFGYARRAASRAMGQLAYEEAVRLYRMALEALELAGEDESILCDLLLSLGEAEIAAGRGTESKETFLQAAEIARRTSAPEQLAHAALGYGGRLVWLKPSDARLVPLLEEALVAVGEADTVLRARLLARLAGASRGDPSPERRESLSLEAVAVARLSGDPVALVHALLVRRLAVWAPDKVDELLEISAEMVQLADEAGDPDRAGDARLMRLEAHLIRGDIDSVWADLETAARLADKARRPPMLWHVAIHKAELALLEGRFDEAERLIADMVSLGSQAQVSDAPVSEVTLGFALRWALGGLGEISSDVERLAQEQPMRPLFRCLLAVVDLDLGNEERARHTLEAVGEDDFAAIPRDTDWMLSLALLVEVAVALGNAEQAAVLYRLLEPYRDLVVVDPHEFGTGAAARSLGLAASALGRVEDGERHFEKALELNASIGALPWLARTQGDYSRMLLARDAPGDREKAQELLDAALAMYRELGMDSYAASASALAQEAGVSTR
jgi:DNA-binding SARP family transcriptional activator/class 3 adenylate cyclase